MNGSWMYLYRAVDERGPTIEANRDKPSQVPDEKIVLRYANAIDAKYRKLLGYRC